MLRPDELTDPTTRALVEAVNANDRAAFFALLAPDATMSDDGSDRDLEEWVDREIFSAGGHMDVVSQSGDGRSWLADYRNDTYGQMRTSWGITVDHGKITRFETGQA
jgi:hypothetical protein